MIKKRSLRFDFEKSKFVFVSIIIFTIIIVAAINYLEPYCGDDNTYMKNLVTGERLQNINDVIESQVYHYFEGNGRTIVHTIDQLFFLFDSKLYFDAANTLVTVILLSVIYYLCVGGRISNTFLLIELSFLYLCAPTVGDVLVWQTGACNYLWGSTILLCVFVPYLKHFTKLCENKSYTGKPKILGVVGIGVGGIIAGWTIEAGASMVLFGIGAFLLAQIILWKKKKKDFMKPQIWQISGFVGMILGFCMLIFSPGQMGRLNRVKNAAQHDNFLVEIMYRLTRETYYMIMFLGPVIIALLMVMVINKKGYTFKNYVLKYYSPVLCSLMALVGIYVMTFSVGYAERTLMTPLIFLIIAFGMFYKEINNGNNKALLAVVSISLFVIVFARLATGMYMMYSTGEALNIHWNYTGGLVDLL